MKKHTLLLLLFSIIAVSLPAQATEAEAVYEFTESELRTVLNEHGQEVADEVTATLTRDHLIEKATWERDLEIEKINTRYWEDTASAERAAARQRAITWGIGGISIGVVLGSGITALIAAAF